MESKDVSRKWKILIFIVALFGALVLWIYAIGYDTQDAAGSFRGIPVEITGVNSSGYTVAGISDFSLNIDADVAGTRSVLNGVSVSDFRAYVDISSVNKPGYATLPVSVVAPNGVRVTQQSVQNVTLYIDKFTSKTIQIKIEKTFVSHYQIGEIRSDLYAISLYGPESELRNVEAYCSFDLGTVEDPVVTASGTIMLRDADTKAKISNPYITMTNSTIDVTFVMYDEKSVPVELVLTGGTFLPSEVQFTVSRPSVLLSGPVESLASLSSLKISCDETQAGTGETRTVPVSELIAENDPTGTVSAVDAELVLEYSVVIPEIAYKTVTLSPSAVKVVGAPDGADGLIKVVSGTEVRIFGDSSVIKKYSADSMTAEVDFDSITQNLTTGDYFGVLRISTGDSSVGVVNSVYTVLLDVRSGM